MKSHPRKFDLTADFVRELFNYDPDVGVLVRKKRYQIAHPSKGDGYTRIRVGRLIYQVHRVIWLHVYGEWPSKDIDHINGDKSDNRIENLRDVSHSVNLQNQRRAAITSKTGLLGVHPHQGRFLAQIQINKKIIYLGLFGTAIEGHNAYLDAKRALHDGCTI